MNKISKAMSDVAIAQTLYDRLEETRKNKGIKQVDLVESVGITAKTYRNLKTGAASFSVFIAVMRHLGLLESLDHGVPLPKPSPIQFLKTKEKQQRTKRVRASQLSGPKNKAANQGRTQKPTGQMDVDNDEGTSVQRVMARRLATMTKGKQ